MNAPKDAVVTLYILPLVFSYHGLTERQMLCVLELYLFLKLGITTHNKSYMPTPGVLHTPEALAKLAETLSKEIFVYNKQDEELTLLYKAKSGRALMRDMGLGKSYLHNLYTRTEGWFRGVLLFSTDNLLPEAYPTMTLDELVAYRKHVESSYAKLGNPQITAIHKVTGEVLKFSSQVEMKKAIGYRPSRFYNHTSIHL